MRYLLIYNAGPEYIERRGAFRAEHLKLVADSYHRGELTQAGAFAEPADGAVFVFTTREAAEAFAAADPYVTNQVVRSWQVRQWFVVVGDGAEAVPGFQL